MFKKLLQSTLLAGMTLCLLVSCSSSKPIYVPPVRVDYSAVNAPEEAGIVFSRITQENTALIASSNNVGNYLAINKTGDKLAILMRKDADDNVFTIDLNNKNITQQKTYRNNVVGGFVFSPADDELIFNSSDAILATNSNSGAICRQLTTGWFPSFSSDGKYMYFQRTENSKPFLWRYTVADKELATICPGACATGAEDKNSIYFLREIKRNSKTFFEIRKFNISNGNDDVIFSNENVSPTAVHVSPDGRWLIFGANQYKDGSWQKLQLYALRTNGTDLTQLTYHPAGSFSPVWSRDGRKIYFISGRGNVEGKWGVWSMDFVF